MCTPTLHAHKTQHKTPPIPPPQYHHAAYVILPQRLINHSHSPLGWRRMLRKRAGLCTHSRGIRGSFAHGRCRVQRSHGNHRGLSNCQHQPRLSSPHSLWRYSQLPHGQRHDQGSGGTLWNCYDGLRSQNLAGTTAKHPGCTGTIQQHFEVGPHCTVYLFTYMYVCIYIYKYILHIYICVYVYICVCV